MFDIEAARDDLEARKAMLSSERAICLAAAREAFKRLAEKTREISGVPFDLDTAEGHIQDALADGLYEAETVLGSEEVQLDELCLDTPEALIASDRAYYHGRVL